MFAPTTSQLPSSSSSSSSSLTKEVRRRCARADGKEEEGESGEGGGADSTSSLFPFHSMMSDDWAIESATGSHFSRSSFRL